jgi:hypothetical protein
LPAIEADGTICAAAFGWSLAGKIPAARLRQG